MISPAHSALARSQGVAQVPAVQRPRRASGGFTLVEAMVSIAIFSIVTAMLWGGFSQTARNKARIEGDLDRYHEINAALGRMTREISMAFVSAQLNRNESLRVSTSAFIGKDQGDHDRLDFSSFSHQRLRRDAHESDQNEISYFLASSPTRSGKSVLARREQSRIDGDPKSGGRIQVLLEDVEGLELEYFDSVSREWVSTWDTTQGSMQPNRLPSHVKVTLTVQDPHGRGRQRYGTRVAIPLVWGLNHAVYM